MFVAPDIPDPPSKKRRLEDFSRPHKTGSARTEGYYKMDPREKARTKYHFHRAGVDAFNVAKLGTKEQQKPQKAITMSREARNEQRRLMNILGDDVMDSNLLQLNQLKFRCAIFIFTFTIIFTFIFIFTLNIQTESNEVWQVCYP